MDAPAVSTATSPQPDFAQEFKIHPSAELFPLLEGEEFDELVRDIETHGLNEPIWLHPDGRVLDGRNRLRACIKAGVKPEFRTWTGAGTATPEEFVLSENL